MVVDVEFVSLVVMVVDYGFKVVMGCVDLYVFIFLNFFEREFEAGGEEEESKIMKKKVRIKREIWK